MKNNWITSGNFYALKEVSQQIPELPTAIYRVAEDERTKEIYLLQTQDSFQFQHKIYGIERGFIDRVALTYSKTLGNLGVLLNGTKGTGKTVTARLICNELKLPVLVVTAPYKGLSAFLNDLGQDVIVFFDEYEKVYKDWSDHDILTVFDGVLNTPFRKLFLLTTNKLNVNDNLLQRPGRIRYVKTFTDLTIDAIMEIVDDMLAHPFLRAEVVDFIANLETITIDIVKAVVEEVNIHNEPPSVFGDVFNTQASANNYNVYEVEMDAEPRLTHAEVPINPSVLDKSKVGYDFYVGGKELGEITAVHSSECFTLQLLRDDDDDPKTYKTFRLEKVKKLHRAFLDFAF